MIGKTILHYKILEELGRGGMGVVYLAEDTKLERTVAIKFLPPHIAINSDERKRFETEAKAAAALNHPNIATIHAIEEVDNEMFIVMEYVDGKTLKEYVGMYHKKTVHDTPLNPPLIGGKPINGIPVDESINLTIQIAEGLQTAHDKGIIHRDIKSSNIMITDKSKVKIMDFGLAKIRGGAEITKEKSTLGTVAYMSPEQTRGEEADHRSDIWSFGVVLYEMITGQLPFKGDYDQAIIYSILNEMPDSVNFINSGVAPGMGKIINKCLQKQSTDRYQNFEDLISDLKQLKEKSSSKASISKPEPSPTKKRSPLLVSSIVVSLTLIFVVLYFTIYNTSEEINSSTKRKMLVVLPFKNLGSAEDEYFADGITEEITSRLSEIKQLGIIGRTSADLYKNTEKSIDQIGAELGVDYLLEGSVRWEKVAGSESRIRITPQLIKVSDGTHIWTKRYDAILESVFDLQSDIAEKVAMALDITLLGSEQKSISQKPTDNLEAYDYYLRGNDYYRYRGITEENFKIAEKLFLKVIELDSNFVLPYIGLAQIYTDFYWYHWKGSEDMLTQAMYYIDKAIEINPDLPEIYSALGHYYYHGFLDYDKALIELENGLKIDPDNSEIVEIIGYIKRRQGKFEECIDYLKRSIELNPLSYPNNDIGETYYLLKNYEEAEKYLDIAISNIPEWGTPYIFKAKCYLLRNGDVNRAHQILKASLEVVNQGKSGVIFLLILTLILDGKYEEALKMLSDEPANLLENQFTFLPKAQIMATIYRLENKNDLAKDYYDSARVVIEEKLKELPDDARLYSALGLVFAGLGKKDDAIKEGKRGTELLSITKEAWVGFIRELDLAKIYTMVGEYDLAIDKLEYLLSIPGELSVPYIKLDPVWRPLLDIPRFKNVLEQYN